MQADNRITIASEYCGYPEPRYVVRFCGEWLGQSANKADAKQMAAEFKAEWGRVLNGR